MSLLEKRLTRLETVHGDYGACHRYAQDLARIEGINLTEAELDARAMKIMGAGGPWSFEELLAELDHAKQERKRDVSETETPKV
jgi:hypothetical protein